MMICKALTRYQLAIVWGAVVWLPRGERVEKYERLGRDISALAARCITFSLSGIVEDKQRLLFSLRVLLHPRA